MLDLLKEIEKERKETKYTRQLVAFLNERISIEVIDLIQCLAALEVCNLLPHFQELFA